MKKKIIFIILPIIFLSLFVLTLVLVINPSAYSYLYSKGKAGNFLEFSKKNCNKASTYLIKVQGTDDWNWDEVDLSEGIARVKKQNIYGYIDISGKIISTNKYSDAQLFSEGLAAVYDDNNKWGFINTDGKMVIPSKYGLTQLFKNGVNHVYIKHKWGAIDKSGNIIVKPQWSGFGDFIKIDNSDELLAQVCSNQQWGYINNKDKIVIQPHFKAAQSFYKGIAPVQLDKDTWALIDRKGTILSRVNASFVGDFAEDYACFYSDKEEAYGYIDTKGNIVIPPSFIDYGDFTNGYANVVSKNRGSLVINKKGESVLSIKWDFIGKLSEGIVPVKKNNKWGYVNIALDKIICAPQWEEATSVSHGCAFVRNNGIWNIIEFSEK